MRNGMSSIVKEGFTFDDVLLIPGESHVTPEEVEGGVPYSGALAEIVYQLIDGLRAGMGYTGMPTIAKLRKDARFVKITNAALIESRPHDISITKEAPNYSPKNQ